MYYVLVVQYLVAFANTRRSVKSEADRGLSFNLRCLYVSLIHKTIQWLQRLVPETVSNLVIQCSHLLHTLLECLFKLLSYCLCSCLTQISLSLLL